MEAPPAHVAAVGRQALEVVQVRPKEGTVHGLTMVAVEVDIMEELRATTAGVEVGVDFQKGRAL